MKATLSELAKNVKKRPSAYVQRRSGARGGFMKMNEKKIIVCVLMLLLSVKVFPQSMTLDEAIKTTASELGQRLNNKIPNVGSSNQSIEQTAAEIRQQLTAHNKIAVLNFSSDWQKLSAYVIDELNNAIVRDGSLTVVDRQRLDLVRQEQKFQMSGEVDDKSAQSIGKFLGAQSVLSGSFTMIGKTYRFRIRVITVETGVVQYSNSIEIKKDTILTALTPQSPPPPPPETDYSILQQFGIGLLNIPLGFGSLLFDQDKSWVKLITVVELAGAGLGAGYAYYFGVADKNLSKEEENKHMLIGTGIGFGIGAIIGFGRAFFIHKPGFRTTQNSPFDINIVSTSSNDVGVQMVYTLSF
ncbi:MAG: CsgG/HfaB family protein [Treponema sp.]|jgi:TolB-like protein|nr:CsgG/HfaB family protein [Treponema sp.]